MSSAVLFQGIGDRYRGLAVEAEELSRATALSLLAEGWRRLADSTRAYERLGDEHVEAGR